MVGLDAVAAYTEEIERHLVTARGLAGSRGTSGLRSGRPRWPQAPHFPGRAGRRRESGAAEAFPRVRADAAGARRQGRAPTDLVLPRPVAARAEDREPQVGHAAQASLLPHQAAADVSARPACVAARRRGRRRRSCAMRFRASKTCRRIRRSVRSGGPSARCSKASSKKASKADSASNSCADGSTCRSGASSKVRRRSRIGCAARCSTTSR